MKFLIIFCMLSLSCLGHPTTYLASPEEVARANTNSTQVARVGSL